MPVAVRQAMDAGTVEEADVLADGIHRQVRWFGMPALIDPVEPVIDAVGVEAGDVPRSCGGALGQALGDREGAGFIRYPVRRLLQGRTAIAATTRSGRAPARRAVALVVFLNYVARFGTRRANSTAACFDCSCRTVTSTSSPEAGLLVAFPADVLHEVTEVRGGTRDTIVDWFYDVNSTSA